MPLVPHERVDQQLQAEGERERLVALLAAERDELVLLLSPATTSPHVIAPIETSATIGSPPLLGIPIASGFVPASFGPRRGGRGAAVSSPSGLPPGRRRQAGVRSARASRSGTSARRRRGAHAPAASRAARARPARARGSRSRRARASAGSRPPPRAAPAPPPGRSPRGPRATEYGRDRAPASPALGRVEVRPELLRVGLPEAERPQPARGLRQRPRNLLARTAATPAAPATRNTGGMRRRACG